MIEVRIDGTVVDLNKSEQQLSGGGVVTRSKKENTFEVISPDGAIISLTYAWWAPQQTWTFNINVKNTRGSEGLLGKRAAQSWLPLLPDGGNVGPKPSSNQQRYLDLYDTFSNAWRVSDETSLFDYASGESTATYTLKSWPPESPPCISPGIPPTEPLPISTAEKLCSGVRNAAARADCIFEVSSTEDRSSVPFTGTASSRRTPNLCNTAAC